VNSDLQMPENFDDELVVHLVDHCGLSEDAATKIREIMQTEQVPSSEAAALSGLLTSEQVGEAMRWRARHEEGPTVGVIEAALRRSSRQLVAKWRVDGPELKPGPQLLFAHDAFNLRSEKMRALRTELLLLSNSSTMTLAVVGSGPAEGRSVLAAELALAFGQLGRRTLLVDADMRNPSQHLLFQTSNTFGLADSIEGRHPGLMYEIAGFPSMALLTAGTAPSNPSELLAGPRFERLTRSWRDQFEVVVIDTPPISRFADGLIVATLAGRVLVVSRSVATTFKDLKAMLRRLTMTQAQILGAVINDF
jgi:protein-tyrosine kinase